MVAKPFILLQISYQSFRASLFDMVAKLCRGIRNLHLSFRTSIFDMVAKLEYLVEFYSLSFMTILFDTVAKRVFYRLHGTFSFSTSFTKHGDKIRSQFIYVIKNK